jgi:DNA-binding response OmpR family regulator
MSTILLIDEPEMCRDILSRRLQRKGFNLNRARTVSEGIKIVLSDCPAIILIEMDLAIYDQTGIKELKAAQTSQSIPIIALTRYENEIEQAKEAGCDDYEPIPIELPRLLEKINKLLSTQNKK